MIPAPAPAARCKSDIRRKLHWEKENPLSSSFLFFCDITKNL
jgi:hypothetical protein